MLARLFGRETSMPTPTTGAPPAVASDLEPMTSATVAALRATLDEHDRGTFARSGLLAGLILRDADCYGALAQRILGLQCHPLEVEAASTEARAIEHADYLRALWPRIVSPAAEHDLLASLILLGFAVAQVLWSPGDDGQLVPRLDPWPSEAVEYDRGTQRWRVLTQDQGTLPITPGDGQWVLLTARSVHRPHLWGAIRPTAEWYLRSAYAANDASRRSEVVGTPIWAAHLPAGARQTPDGKAFVRSIRTMGRNAVIPLPRGREESESYDVRLIEAETDAYLIFDWLQRCGGGKIRLAILGQDLTSQNNKVGTNASSDTGEGVTEKVIGADGRALSDCYTQQLARPFTEYRVGDKRLTPHVCVDVEPDEDTRAEAEAMTQMAAAATAWRALGVEVDVEEMARRARVPTMARGQE